ncbi:MAG: hypothetical protein HW416_2651 [Chloroflexi bacterium]|nr:hypothetical protein [Chloroflexota bacterium]
MEPPRRLATTIVLGSLVLAACAPGPSGRAVVEPASTQDSRGAPKRITAAIQGEPLTLYENINHAGGGSAPGVDSLETMINMGLVAVDSHSVLQPALAEAVPGTDNGLWRLLPDGRMETTWRIRDGASWHDGRPFTSADVLFTVQVETDRDVPVRRADGYQYFESIEAADSQTVTVRWKQPYIWADRAFTSPFMPMHLLGRAYEENKANFTQLALWSEEFVGTGPYRVREFARSIQATLNANPTFVLGKPAIDEIVVRFIADSNTLIANVLAGEIDVLLQGSGRGLSLEQALQVRDQWREGTLQIKYASWFVVYPQFHNPSNPIVLDVQFRRALLHAIDRQQLVDSLQGSMTSVAHAFLSPNEPEYQQIQSRIAKYEYDPRRAAQIIEGLGLSRGVDGAFRDRAGQPLQLEARTTSSDLYQKTLFALTDFWQNAGIGIDPVVVPPQRTNDREYRANFPALDVTGQPNRLGDLFQYFHSSEARTAENSFTGENRARYRSPDLDRLLDRFTVTIPRAERAAVLGDVMAYMTEQLNVLGLYYTVSPTLIGNRLVNSQPSGEGGNQAWNVHQWDVK